MTDQQFYADCASHDWAWRNASSHARFCAGMADERIIQRAAKQDAHHGAMYAAWRRTWDAWMRGDRTATTPKSDEWVRPEPSIDVIRTGQMTIYDAGIRS